MTKKINYITKIGKNNNNPNSLRIRIPKTIKDVMGFEAGGEIKWTLHLDEEITCTIEKHIKDEE